MNRQDAPTSMRKVERALRGMRVGMLDWQRFTGGEGREVRQIELGLRDCR
jgi:hypothetical protein